MTIHFTQPNDTTQRYARNSRPKPLPRQTDRPTPGPAKPIFGRYPEPVRM
jgi:hypothetical protein